MVFLHLNTNYLHKIWLSEQVVLITKYSDPEKLNEFDGDLIPGDSKPFMSVDSIDCAEEHEPQYAAKVLNDISESDLLTYLQTFLKMGYAEKLFLNLQPNSHHVSEAWYIVKTTTNGILFLQVSIKIDRKSVCVSHELRIALEVTNNYFRT